MFLTLLTYFLPVLQLLFPLYFLYRLWTRPYKTRFLWLIELLVTSGFLAVMYFIGRWDITGYFLRCWLYGAYLLAARSSAIRISGKPFFVKKHFTWKFLPGPACRARFYTHRGLPRANPF